MSSSVDFFLNTTRPITIFGWKHFLDMRKTNCKFSDHTIPCVSLAGGGGVSKPFFFTFTHVRKKLNADDMYDVNKKNPLYNRDASTSGVQALGWV